MRYLDSEVLGMLNSINNISFENYNVSIETVDEQSYSDNSSNSSEISDKSSSDTAGSGGSTTEQDNQKIKSKMIPNSILTNSKEIDWDSLKNKIENLYATWPTIVLDLNQINVNNDDIVSFSKVMDEVTKNMKDENKIETLKSLGNLYSYIEKYVNSNNIDEFTKKLYSVKNNIISAYVIVEENNWNEVRNNVLKAEEKYKEILNNAEIIGNNNTVSINKGYILINELLKSLDEQDLDIFYIKYKNIMEELNTL